MIWSAVFLLKSMNRYPRRLRISPVQINFPDNIPMSNQISKSLLDRLSAHLSSEIGLYFSEHRHHDLMRGIRSAAKEFEFTDIETCIIWLLESPLTREQIEVLARHLTIGETYFMRETKVIEALETRIFPEIISKRRDTSRRIRIWSAGCCTGEEAYSMSIILNRLIADIDNWDIKIIGTDINPVFLAKAIKAEYTEWSFRNIPVWIKETFFTRTDKGRYQVIPKIQKIVKFGYLNLALKNYNHFFPDLHQIDIILCRNVLMYFNPERIKEIGNSFYDILDSDGWLIVGSSETSQMYFPKYQTVNFPGAILYKRKNKTDFEENKMPVKTPGRYSYDKPRKRTKAILKPVPKPKEKEKKEENKSEWIDRVINHYHQGEYHKVICEAETHLITEKDASTQLMLLLAKSYASLGKPVHALNWCRKAIMRDKLNPQSYQLQATILQEQDKNEEAIQSLKQVLYLDPDYLVAHFMLGNLTRQSGRISESDKYYKNTLSLLKNYDKETMLPETEGITAGGLIECIRIMTGGDQ